MAKPFQVHVEGYDAQGNREDELAWFGDERLAALFGRLQRPGSRVSINRVPLADFVSGRRDPRETAERIGARLKAESDAALRRLRRPP